MTDQTSLSTLSLALMGLISHEPMSGYDIRKVFIMTPLGHFSSSPGAIYPALERLEADGLLEGKVENPDTLRPRKVYDLTEEGREVLTEALLAPVTVDDVIWRDDQIVLRFVMMERNVPTKYVLRFLEQVIEATQAYLDTLREQLANYPDGPQFGRFALQHGIEGYEATVRWAREVIQKLQEAQ